ncbi:PREDICTED: uncharacterized protein LOC109585333 isoform X2 [Amphimedon queenslandica]|uniref:Uncharacterized protein n=1 Tax=Amphimedon queenslandica TaxID=400682 RepID=A0AAN0JJQ8_AMPQE|nr:PREDICTED: uncharacterized protein LOC109585333 isoform X2 [Amphimedon queenslandica]|eukprot:XP_019856913.1 PREDICTED: uncharacterized protein LOC109585333 isoform X2 [Amphimedon queenslandica]
MVVEIIAEVLSIPEPAARFLFGLLLTYPLAFIYRPLIIPYASKNTQSIICAAGGFALLQYVFGLSASLHFLLDVILVYCVFLLFGKGRVSLLLTWIITMDFLAGMKINIPEYKAISGIIMLFVLLLC